MQTGEVVTKIPLQKKKTQTEQHIRMRSHHYLLKAISPQLQLQFPRLFQGFEEVMNSELLKEYNAFKKRSLATPSVESTRKRAAPEGRNQDGKARPARPQRRSQLPAQLLQQSKKQAQAAASNYKTSGIVRSKTRFSILASIVDLMRKR